jgi:hypothetical protein
MNAYQTPVAQKIQELKELGYTKEFDYRHNRLKDISSEQLYRSNEICKITEFRIQGNNNPQDVFSIYAVECRDGSKGMIISTHANDDDEYLDDFMMMAA